METYSKSRRNRFDFRLDASEVHSLVRIGCKEFQFDRGRSRGKLSFVIKSVTKEGRPMQITIQPERLGTAPRPPTDIIRFTADHPEADRVFLVEETHGGTSRWIEMHRPAPNRLWAVDVEPGYGTFSYKHFVVEDESFINAGSFGLIAEKVTGSGHKTASQDRVLASS